MPFRLPTHVTIRPGCLDELGEIVQRRGVTRVLLVTDGGLSSTPWPSRVEASLSRAACEVARFLEVENNPRLETTDALGALARREGRELVIGLGGGSVLDAAKAAAMLATNGGSCRDYEGRNRFAETPLPFVAIPTTCGTGSEVTWVSVISDEAQKRKLSVKGDGMFPDDALVDADLLETLPADLVAQTGVDALTHAVEATIGRAANPVSDALATAAIRLTFEFLPRAFADVGGDREAREAVARASTLAGIAFGNADVAGVHCLSESIGGLYDVPHGLANAVLLARVLRHQLDAARAALETLHEAVFDDPAPDAALAMVERIERLVAKLSIPGFDALGVPRDALAQVAEMAERNNSNPSNPRPMTSRDYLEILSSLAG